MSLHLHLVCGRYHVAIDIARVIGLSPADQTLTLPMVDMRQILAVPAALPPARVLMVGGFALAVDRVLGMVDTAKCEAAPLPPSFRRAAPLFDALLTCPAEEEPLLRLAADYDFPVPSPKAVRIP